MDKLLPHLTQRPRHWSVLAKESGLGKAEIQKILNEEDISMISLSNPHRQKCACAVIVYDGQKYTHIGLM